MEFTEIIFICVHIISTTQKSLVYLITFRILSGSRFNPENLKNSLKWKSYKKLKNFKIWGKEEFRIRKSDWALGDPKEANYVLEKKKS